MKAVFIAFDQAHLEMIQSILDHHNCRGFSYWENIQGRGSRSHAWPSMNSAILTMVEDRQVDGLLKLLNNLDKQKEALGLRAFVWNIEQSI